MDINKTLKVWEIFKEFEKLKHEVIRLGAFLNEMFFHFEWNKDAPKSNRNNAAEIILPSIIQIAKNLKENVATPE